MLVLLTACDWPSWAVIFKDLVIVSAVLFHPTIQRKVTYGFKDYWSKLLQNLFLLCRPDGEIFEQHSTLLDLKMAMVIRTLYSFFLINTDSISSLLFCYETSWQCDAIPLVIMYWLLRKRKGKEWPTWLSLHINTLITLFPLFFCITLSCPE